MKDHEKNLTVDLGTGSVKKLLFKLAVPTVVAQVINLLYNIVDRIYIGHIPEIGAAALTGVGLCMPIIALITAFAMLVGAGGAPLAAIALGQDDKDKAEKIIGNCFTLVIILSIVLTALFYIFTPQLLTLFGASPDTLPYGVEYSRTYVLGTIFILGVMGLNPFITSQGFSQISMLTTVIGAVINIILDPIFIFVFKMGVRGAALASVLSQAVSFTWIFHFITGKKTLIKLSSKNLRLHRKIIMPCLGLGVSSFVMAATESLLAVSFTSSLARYGGDLAVGAMVIITSINQLIMMPLQGLCQGAQPLMGYNFGARKNDRVKEAFFTQFFVCIGFTFLSWILILAAPQLLAKIFNDDPALIDATVWAMRIYFLVLFSIGFQVSCQQSFIALGQAKVSLFLACLRKIILLIPLIFIMPLFFENKVFAVFLAEPVSDLIAATVTTIVFMTRFNKILAKGPEK